MKVSVAWLAKDGVYAFAQVVNPGPTVLTRYGQHTEATLREQVKGVLAIRSRLGHSPDDLTRVNRAFFHVNAVVSIGLFAIACIDLLV